MMSSDKYSIIKIHFLEIILMVAWIFGLLSVSILVGIPSATGYELSPYTALPIVFWVLFLLSCSGFIFSAVNFSFSGSYKDKLLWLFAVIGIFMNTLIIMFLPDLRGYYLKGLGDFVSHLGQSKIIESTGYINDNIFYPVSFVIVQIVHLVTGLEVETIWNYGGAVIYLFFLLCVFLAAKKIHVKAAPISVIAGAIAIAGAYIPSLVPGNLSVFILPLVIYLYMESREKNQLGYVILFLLIILIFPFLHPLSSLLMVAVLLVMETAKWLSNRILLHRSNYDGREDKINNSSQVFQGSSALALFITWFLWVSLNYEWRRNIIIMASWFRGEGSSQLERVTYLAERAQYSIWDTSLLILKDKGGILVYGGLSFLILVILLIKPDGRNFLKNLGYRVISLYAFMILLILLTGISLVGPLGYLDPGRFLRYTIPFSILLIGLIYHDIFAQFKQLVISVISIILIVAAFGGYFAMHGSPYKFQPNTQVTSQDLTCINWLLVHKSNYEITGIWRLNRYVDLVLGPSNRDLRTDISYYPLPEHFGYDQELYLGDNYSKMTYFPITAYDRATTLDLWKVANKFNADDFARLQMDPSVIRIYSNGECEAWVTNPIHDNPIQNNQ